MKQLMCEMCCSTDILKQDGVFVCQACGCKYSVEEAKRMMIEGTVDVQGTVKVDNSAFVQKYLANARRAYEKEDWEEVEKYYNMVEQNDPTNIEAIFYSSYGKAKTSLTSDDIYKRQAVFKVLQNCVSIIDDNYTIEKEEEELEIIRQITVDIINMACSGYVYTEWKDGYGNVTRTNKGETEALFLALSDEYATSLKNIIAKYDANDRHRVKTVYEMVIKIYEFQRDHMGLNAQGKNLCNKQIVEMHTQIKAFEPDHVVPVFQEIQSCYVATAVYGSYNCPEVWTLRRFRDDRLARTWYGRAFIRTYYAISPTLVKWFGHTQWFKKMWKGKLDRMVANLNAEGVENTPYQDKAW
jgi:hypothetical protein